MEALTTSSDVSFTPCLRACLKTCYMIAVARKAAAALNRVDVPESCPVSESYGSAWCMVVYKVRRS